MMDGEIKKAQYKQLLTKEQIKQTEYFKGYDFEYHDISVENVTFTTNDDTVAFESTLKQFECIYNAPINLVIQVKTLNHKTINISFRPADTIRSIKQKI